MSSKTKQLANEKAKIDYMICASTVASDVKKEIDGLTDHGRLDTNHRRWDTIQKMINDNLTKARMNELDETTFIAMLHDDDDNISFLFKHHTDLYTQHCAVHELLDQLIDTCMAAFPAGTALDPQTMLKMMQTEERMLKQCIENLNAKAKDMSLNLNDLKDPGSPTTKALGTSWSEAKVLVTILSLSLEYTDDAVEANINNMLGIAVRRTGMDAYLRILTATIQPIKTNPKTHEAAKAVVQVLKEERKAQRDSCIAEDVRRNLWLRHREKYASLKSEYIKNLIIVIC